MATERIVSPGVFTNEKDQSFLEQGIEAIGAAFIGPTIKGRSGPYTVSSYSEFVEEYGGFSDETYLPYAVKEYLKNAGSATIVRVLGTSGYTLTNPVTIKIHGSYGERVIAVLHPTQAITTDGTTGVFNATSLLSNESGSFVIDVSGSFSFDSTGTAFHGISTDPNGTSYSASFDPTNKGWLGNLFGQSPKGNTAAYNYVLFKNIASMSLAQDAASTASISIGSSESWDFTPTGGHVPAYTPWITSQKVNGNTTYDLFRVHRLQDGTSTNYEMKVGIQDVIPAGSVAGSEYGAFTLIVRAVDQDKIVGSPYNTTDSDQRPNILETFSNLSLDPESPRFIGRVIGDQYVTYDSYGKQTINGEYPNKSKYIRVELKEAVKNGALSNTLVPFGFRALYNTIPSAFATTSFPSCSFVAAQTINGAYNANKFFGFDYDFSGTDNLNYLKPLPDTTTVGSNIDFALENFTQHASADGGAGAIGLTSATDLDSRKFMVPFQGGFDGIKPNTQKRTQGNIISTNTQGFDCSSTSATGYTAYKKAIDSISNPLTFDLNMIVLPGVLHSLHSAVTTYAKDMAEERSDVFYPMDNAALNDTITTNVETVQTFDSNYVATYYPWIKYYDTDKNRPVWAPPSVVVPAAIAFNDKVGFEWNAPAGLNRGGLPNVVALKDQLTRKELNTVYDDGRINPIIKFPGQGPVIWGQKTLQGKPSALDRIGVRRLLISAKKFIASSTRYLVFEQNTATTRNRFLNIVNPYFENVQQKQGLTNFFVKMDEENNTPDIIDRNILYGQIYLQPSKTAEFIILDFNIQPGSATFGE